MDNLLVICLALGGVWHLSPPVNSLPPPRPAIRCKVPDCRAFDGAFSRDTLKRCEVRRRGVSSCRAAGNPGPGSASPEFTALENSDRQRIGGGRVWARGGQCLGRDRANAIPLSRNLGVPPVENTRTAKVWTALRRMVSMSSAATDGEFHVWPSSVNSES